MFVVSLCYSTKIGSQYVDGLTEMLGVFSDSQIAWQSIALAAGDFTIDSDYPESRCYRKPNGDLLIYRVDPVPHYSNPTGF